MVRGGERTEGVGLEVERGSNEVVGNGAGVRMRTALSLLAQWHWKRIEGSRG